MDWLSKKMVLLRHSSPFGTGQKWKPYSFEDIAFSEFFGRPFFLLVFSVVGH